MPSPSSCTEKVRRIFSPGSTGAVVVNQPVPPPIDPEYPVPTRSASLVHTGSRVAWQTLKKPTLIDTRLPMESNETLPVNASDSRYAMNVSSKLKHTHSGN